MPRIAIVFLLTFGFSLLYHWLLGGSGELYLGHTVVKIELWQVIIAALLLSNLISLLIILWRKD